MGGIDLGFIYLIGNGILFLFIIIVICYIYFYFLMLYCDDFENVVKLIIEVVKCLDKEKVIEICLGWVLRKEDNFYGIDLISKKWLC